MQTKRLFVIRNQFDQYLDKHSGWISGKDPQALYRSEHHDQALNTLIEVNSKDISLRGDIIEVDSDEKKRPVVEVSEAAIALDIDLAKMEAENPSDLELAGLATDESSEEQKDSQESEEPEKEPEKE